VHPVEKERAKRLSPICRLSLELGIPADAPTLGERDREGLGGGDRSRHATHPLFWSMEVSGGFRRFQTGFDQNSPTDRPKFSDRPTNVPLLPHNHARFDHPNRRPTGQVRIRARERARDTVDGGDAHRTHDSRARNDRDGDIVRAASGPCTRTQRHPEGAQHWSTSRRCRCRRRPTLRSIRPGPRQQASGGQLVMRCRVGRGGDDAGDARTQR
jgi:hypothetical protein